MYTENECDITIIAGDLNGRIGDTQDFIEDLDCLPKRQIVDTYKNQHGQSLVEFLYESQHIMLYIEWKV